MGPGLRRDDAGSPTSRSLSTIPPAHARLILPYFSDDLAS